MGDVNRSALNSGEHRGGTTGRITGWRRKAGARLVVWVCAALLSVPGFSQHPVAAPVSVWTAINEKAVGAPDTGYNTYKAALRERAILQSYYRRYAGWTAPAPFAPRPGFLANLGDKPDRPRFPLTDKVWPEKPGTASICLWEDDKVAAVSISIDDNNAQDVPAWKEISKRYGGLPITWFLISDNIDGTLEPRRSGAAGTWRFWQGMLSEGFHLESHSVTHVGDPVVEDGWPGPDWEAAESIRQLDSGLAGHRTRVFAYPGSAIPQFNLSLNWRASAVGYYAAARGTSGIPINIANMTDYFDIRTTSSPAGFIIDDPAQATRPFLAEGNYHNILDASAASNPYHKYYRGWATVFTHDLGNTGAELLASSSPERAALARVFDFFDRNRDKLWIGALGDVALYGQERDMATVTTHFSNADSIGFELISRMDPGRFDYPLTVKVRLPAGWKEVGAIQAGGVIPAAVVEHAGALFALVKAIPNKGVVSLKPAYN